MSTYNKVTFNNQTLIDLSQDTVTSAEHIVAGRVGHLADGTQVAGTAESGWTVDDIEGGAPTGDVISTGTSVRVYAYAGSTITSYTNEVITDMSNQYEFHNCKQLTSVHLPKLTKLNTQTFNGCSALPVIVLPSLTTMTSYNLISNCTNLTIADFGDLSKIRPYTFNADGKLRTLILRRTSSITGMDIWDAACMGGIFSKPAESTIYVPSALVETYKTATNWSTAYSAGLTFAPIEGSQYENYYADGTAIS